MATRSTTAGLSRNPAVALAATAILAAGIAFVVRGGGNDNVIDQWEATNGERKAYMTSSGNLVSSGSITLDTSGNFSGSTLNLAGGASGKILCFQTNGRIGTCSAAVYGAGVCNCQ